MMTHPLLVSQTSHVFPGFRYFPLGQVRQLVEAPPLQVAQEEGQEPHGTLFEVKYWFDRQVSQDLAAERASSPEHDVHLFGPGPKQVVQELSQRPHCALVLTK